MVMMVIQLARNQQLKNPKRYSLRHIITHRLGACAKCKTIGVGVACMKSTNQLSVTLTTHHCGKLKSAQSMPRGAVSPF